MCYLLRTDDDYRICYGKPERPFVITSNGSYFGASEYQKMCDDSKEVEINTSMEDDNFPIDSWADTCQDDKGIVVSCEIAEYLLQGKSIHANEFVQLEVVI